MAKAARDFPKVEVDGRAALRAWLRKNHAKSNSVWIVTYKKGDPRYISAAGVAEEALCFGWIDSLPRALDAKRTMLLVSPRKAGSAWSRLNKDRVARMIAAKRLTQAGLKAVARAKADGSWSKLDAVEALRVPKDLAAAFKLHAHAAANFNAFPRSAKRGILEWIIQARKPETRLKRVLETARLAARNLRANQWRS